MSNRSTKLLVSMLAVLSLGLFSACESGTQDTQPTQQEGTEFNQETNDMGIETQDEAQTTTDSTDPAMDTMDSETESDRRPAGVEDQQFGTDDPTTTTEPSNTEETEQESGTTY